jgi:transposase
MNLPIRIGMDTSKSVFQLHGVDENEVVVVRRQFRRAEMIRYFERLPPVLVAIESCGSSHHWARLLQSFGHEVKLIPPQYVKAYVKRGKNDAADAEALASTRSRPPISARAWSRWSGKRRRSRSGSRTRESGSSRSFWPRSSTGRSRRKGRCGTRSSKACARIWDSTLATGDARSDHWIVGLDDITPEVSGSSHPSARLHSHGIPAPHWQP